MRPVLAVVLTALIVAPPGAKAADLVVWWEKGFYPQADEAVAEIVTTFEQDTGKEVELVQPTQSEIQDKATAAVGAGQPPDFLFSSLSQRWIPRWAYEDRFADLEGVLGPVLGLFDADAIEVSMLLNGNTGRRGLYALPMGRVSNHVHVWNSLLGPGPACLFAGRARKLPGELHQLLAAAAPRGKEVLHVREDHRPHHTAASSCGGCAHLDGGAADHG